MTVRRKLLFFTSIVILILLIFAGYPRYGSALSQLKSDWRRASWDERRKIAEYVKTSRCMIAKSQDQVIDIFGIPSQTELTFESDSDASEIVCMRYSKDSETLDIWIRRPSGESVPIEDIEMLLRHIPQVIRDSIDCRRLLSYKNQDLSKTDTQALVACIESLGTKRLSYSPILFDVLVNNGIVTGVYYEEY